MPNQILVTDIYPLTGAPLRITFAPQDYPVAPMVSVSNTDVANVFNVHIIAYIPPESLKVGLSFDPPDGSVQIIKVDDQIELPVRCFLVDYDSSGLPDSFMLWNIRAQYKIDGESVDFVRVRVRDLDPKTSRGTVTTVQEANNI
jgi:hypothetical protein